MVAQVLEFGGGGRFVVRICDGRGQAIVEQQDLRVRARENVDGAPVERTAHLESAGRPIL